VNGSVLRAGRTGERAAHSWQLRAWPNDPAARLLVFLDHLNVPTGTDLTTALAQAHADGASVVRTSALFPRAAEVVLAAGFNTIDTLALLRRPVDHHLDRDLESLFGPTLPRTTPMRPWHHQRAALVDQDAFGAVWGNDTRSLAEIRRATPVHRARLRRDGRTLLGFAISGAAGDSGYIQRLAVSNPARRRGTGRDLVVDALVWMRHRGLSTAYVNTGVHNTAALALYDVLGFVHMDDRLVIAERRLDG
jgi:GNAT superfamily N-acetyltransferase